MANQPPASHPWLHLSYLARPAPPAPTPQPPRATVPTPWFRPETKPITSPPSDPKRQEIEAKKAAEKTSPNAKIDKQNGKSLKKRPDSDDGVGMSVIKIAGENQGAVMELRRDRTSKKHGSEGRPRFLYEKKSDLSDGSESDNVEGRSKSKSHKGSANRSHLMIGFMNSNVQGINNSIVYNSSCSHHDPGVHLTLSMNDGTGVLHVTDGASGHQEK